MTAEQAPDQTPGAPPAGAYRRLGARFVALTLSCALLPLWLVAAAIYEWHAAFITQKTVASFQARVQNHRDIIRLYLRQQKTMLRICAQTHTLDEAADPQRFAGFYASFNQDADNFTDLGVIDGQGNHRAYLGPYLLLDKNYAQTFWFQRVMKNSIYISDMFLGFREEPHFVIAVAGSPEAGPWILRATVNTERFRALVETVLIGETGEVFLVDRQGRYQTTPRFGGGIMAPSGLAMGEPFAGIQVTQTTDRDPASGQTTDFLVGSAWLDDPQWLLVVKQRRDEAMKEASHLFTLTLWVLALSGMVITGVTVLITAYMIRQIKRRDAQSQILHQQLMQTGKLAAIGELSAGVAHEINNPLAIVLTERQLILDAAQFQGPDSAGFQRQLHESLDQIQSQVARCKRITQNLLRFARRTQPCVEPVDLNGFLRELAELMEREARKQGVSVVTDLDPGLKPLKSDPSLLQQVFLNLINNAIDAHQGQGGGTITLSTRVRAQGGALVSVRDQGMGIAPQNLGRIFDPFFTTKPVGRGTGLGLSITHSIMQGLGGGIEVRSQPGQGTTFSLWFPPEAPARRASADGSADHV